MTKPTITTGALPGSRKIWQPGQLHDIRVPLRQTAVSGDFHLASLGSSLVSASWRPSAVMLANS